MRGVGGARPLTRVAYSRCCVCVQEKVVDGFEQCECVSADVNIMAHIPTVKSVDRKPLSNQWSVLVGALAESQPRRLARDDVDTCTIVVLWR